MTMRTGALSKTHGHLGVYLIFHVEGKVTWESLVIWDTQVEDIWVTLKFYSTRDSPHLVQCLVLARCILHR